MPIPGITLDFTDLLFALAQLRLPGNTPLTPLDPTGIRDTQGVSNNIANPLYGNADQPFTRDTYNVFTFQRTLEQAQLEQQVTGSANLPLFTTVGVDGQIYRGWGDLGLVNWSKNTNGGAYSLVAPGSVVPGRNAVYNPGNVVDYSVRGIDLYDSRPRTISNLVAAQENLPLLLTLDDPSRAPGGRLVPLGGLANNLPASGWTALFGQFFDHGVDFLHKGADGKVFIPLLPSDPLYSSAPGARNFMVGSRSNTDANKESENTVSPFIDLSQSYGSAMSHTALVREYHRLLNGDVVPTGNLVNGAGSGTQIYTAAQQNPSLGEMATWADIKANAAVVGLTMRDYNVEDVPEVRLNADGTLFLQGGNQAFFVAYRAIDPTQTPVYVTDTDKAALAAAGLVLKTTGHAWADDLAPFSLSGATVPTGFQIPPGFTAADFVMTAAGDNPANYDLVMQANFTAGGFGEFQSLARHFMAGDGRVNENIGLTTIHDIFHKEHNRNVAKLILDQGLVYNPADGSYTGPDGAGGTTVWTGEEVFQHAKLITEALYQHLVFDEFARKLSPNINVFGSYDITIDARISAEFAHAVYRFGHSMLRETVDLGEYNQVTGIPTGNIGKIPLLTAFLAPELYNGFMDGAIAVGMQKQVMSEIDEWVTPVLRNALVGQKLDLAALNIMRGRDTGLPSWNDTRADLFAQTGMTTLKPFASWDEVGMNLLHPDITLKNLIKAYARDAILLQYGTPGLTLANWAALELADTTTVKTYANALEAAATAAMNDPAFMMGGNTDFWEIDLWMGGLAEKKVPNGMLGATLDAIFATQMLKQQNGDRFYYLARLAGTNILAEIETARFADVVMRNTGVKHLYQDIFSVPDATVEIGNAPTFGSLTALRAANTAGIVAGTFWGNLGNYTDGRGVLNPNGVGNASEVLGGNDAPNRINGAGGNDTVWADGGNDTVEGGAGNDFLHGGEGNDVITDSSGDDLLWGEGGNDTINGGSGVDIVFGQDGNDRLFGGLGADEILGGFGADTIFGDNGAVDANGNLDPTGDGDLVDGGDGNDTIYGGGGNDLLDGGVGNDTIYGGIGDDAHVGLDGLDVLIADASDIGYGQSFDGGLDFDIVDYTRSNGVGGVSAITGGRLGVDVNLSNGGTALIPVGALPADTFLAVEGVIGSGYDDILSGAGALGGPSAVQVDALGLPILDALGNPIPINFQIAAGLGDDSVVGGDGLDTLNGGGGNDTMTGGLAIDRWVFTTELGANNVDTITDYEAGERIVLNRSAFTRVNGTAALTAAEFRSGAGVTTTNAAAQRIVYNTTNGDLFYDRDGVGGTPAVRFARLEADPLTAVVPTITAATFILAGAAPAVDVVLNGTANADVLTTLAGFDAINGLGGNDTIDAGAGNDTMNGGDGSDQITTGSGADVVLFNSLLGPTNVDRIVDFSQEDSLRLDRTVFNTVSSGGVLNAAELVQGAGVVTASTALQRVIYNTANGSLYYDADGNGTAYSPVQFAVLTNRAPLTAAQIQLQGTVAGSVLNGTPGNDTLVGLSGNDTINGAAGNDSLNGGWGNDLINGFTGNDTMTGGGDADQFFFTAAPNALTNLDVVTDFGTGADSLVFDRTAFPGLSAGATLTAAEFRSGAGVTTANTAAQRFLYNTTTGDLFFDADGNNAATAPVAVALLSTRPVLTAGAIQLTGAGGAAAINGTVGNDVLTGTANADLINGLAGNDALNGVGGNDTLNGGTGIDTLVGGAGIDTFVFDATPGATNVDTLDLAAGELVQLSRTVYTGFAALGTIAANQFLEVRVGGGTPVAGAATNRVLHDRDTGNLWYDADGTGALAPVRFGAITGGFRPTNANFAVIA